MRNKKNNKNNRLMKIKIWDDSGKPVFKDKCKAKDLSKSFGNILKKFN